MWFGTVDETLEQFKYDIDQWTHKCPRFWREDLAQELRLVVLKCLRAYDGQLRADIVRKKMADKVETFERLERNRGVTNVPKSIDACPRCDCIHTKFHRKTQKTQWRKCRNCLYVFKVNPNDRKYFDVDWEEVKMRSLEQGYTVRHVGNSTIFEKHV